MSGAGLAALSGLTKLEHLDLSGAAVGNEITMTSSLLPQLRHLRSLYLAQCPVTDAGMCTVSQ